MAQNLEKAIIPHTFGVQVTTWDRLGKGPKTRFRIAASM